MRRKLPRGGPAYAVSALGLVLVGLFGWLLLPDYPATALLLMLAVAVGLTGLAISWTRRMQRLRRRGASEQVEI